VWTSRAALESSDAAKIREHRDIDLLTMRCATDTRTSQVLVVGEHSAANKVVESSKERGALRIASQVACIR